MAGRIIQVKKIPGRGHIAGPSKTVRENAVEILAELCYFYPGYTLASARRVPFRDVIILLRKARALKADEYRTLSQVALAPHAKKGEAKKLYDHFTKIIESF